MDKLNLYDTITGLLILLVFAGPIVAADPVKYGVSAVAAAWIGLAAGAVAYWLNRRDRIGDGK